MAEGIAERLLESWRRKRELPKNDPHNSFPGANGDRALVIRPLLERIGRIDLRWRLLFVIAIQLVYMAASRIIAREVDWFAQEEILRTPWRIAAAILFWITMRDVLIRPVSRPETLRNRPFLTGLAFMMAAPRARLRSPTPSL